MRVLVLGAAGLQAKVAIWDLLRDGSVVEVIAADADSAGLSAMLAAVGPGGGRLTTNTIDASDVRAVADLMAAGVDVAIDLLPSRLMPQACEAALAARCHLVNTNYAQALPSGLDARAAAAGITILPEAGLDPGIDLVLCGHGAAQLDTVLELHSYCGGIPEASVAAGSPIGYKISWSWEGVLKAYSRPAVLVRDGETVSIPAEDQHDRRWVTELDFPGVGRLELIPNGDARHFVELLGLGRQVTDASRATFRWPGHSAFWKAMTDLGFLSEAPGLAGGPSPREFMVRHLEPRLQYAPGERDLVVMRVVVGGLAGGRRVRLTYDLVDQRDLSTGFLAMNRTVGFAASIAAGMVARGEIARRGVLAAVRDIPREAFLERLAERGIVIEERREEL
jgi:saccharopine dehydrogenase-like NADP-dependent oxidoreductase